MSQMFTPAELEKLAMSGHQRMLAAANSGSNEELRQEFDHVVGLYTDLHRLFNGWMTSIITFTSNTFGHDSAKAIVAVEDLFGNYADTSFSLASIRSLVRDAAARFQERLDLGDLDGAIEFYLEVEKGAKDLHDFYRDYCGSLLTNVYRNHGVDALQDCLEYSCEKDWLDWYAGVNKLPPKERIIATLEFYAIANFGKLRITEEGDWIHAVQDPCGSCGRQQRGGRYEEPWNLAIVEEKHPLSYGQGGNTVYRAHVAMMHHIMPIKLHGGPWPHKQCPRSKFGTCHIRIHKENPYQPVANEDIHWSD
ncbi:MULTISPECIES: hypothetical protein [Pseudovibrio]|uniref:hypothetical protein n=1 Tax=Stappiaceae TaxID=2821832 RepID=UPI002366F392|nr:MULTISPECIES: hypothetical protein [Pseudovibrio]MDD7910847.1 hypothetical protein [Pseudovibrio exalbescens]MDX5593444.1 hypothetical protein [Pseudovibrio sp. SPO723]